jgi:hypothetical protein
LLFFRIKYFHCVNTLHKPNCPFEFLLRIPHFRRFIFKPVFFCAFKPAHQGFAHALLTKPSHPILVIGYSSLQSNEAIFSKRRDYFGASNIGFRVRNWFSFILLLGFGYLIQTTQARAIGASSFDEGDKIYLSSSSPTGEKPQSTFLLENIKDKVLLEQPVLIIPRFETKKICRHSDFLTIARTRIYKSQNDP